MNEHQTPTTFDGTGRPLDPAKWEEVERLRPAIGGKHIAAARADALWLEDRDHLYLTFPQPDGSVVIARSVERRG